MPVMILIPLDSSGFDQYNQYDYSGQNHKEQIPTPESSAMF